MSMMINASGPSTPTDVLAAPRASGAASPQDALGRDAFLQLLVAQLRHQDPLNPLNGSDFIAQTAQFTMVERMDQMARQNSESMNLQRILGATTFVGRDVTWWVNGTERTGSVTGVNFDGGEPVLTIGEETIPLWAVASVTSASAARSTSTTSNTA
jgi:flagellar basal-body rod modification protein FlgD